MGCAQCINKNSKTLSSSRIRELRRRIIRERLDNLKPSKMMKQEELLRIKGKIERNIKLQIDHKRQETREQTQQQQLVEFRFIIDSWKCLVLCSGLDLYEQHLGIDPSITHKCFGDIEKDIDRTFPENKQFHAQKRIQFKQILERLGVYFPKLGYTQGINFIVGYFMILGFDKQETFWMIVHIFLKQEFLFIGFFENEFPLSEIYCELFRYLFQKNCEELSNHFQKLNVNDKMWIFKWFITAYVYSLPFESIKYVWDYMMVVGGFGLIYFAVSLIKSLESHLKLFQEDLQVIQFLSQLKDKQQFDSLVNLETVILNSYEYKLLREEVENVVVSYKLKSGINNFYVEYFSNYTKFQIRSYNLKHWHNNKVKQRYDYIRGQTKCTFIQKQPTYHRFRVKKQKSQRQLIQLPKIIQQEQQNQVQQLKSQTVSIQRIQPIVPIMLQDEQSKQIQIGQFAHRISFKKKKNNQHIIELRIQPHLVHQMSEKVLPKKSTPKRIKRRVSKMSGISDKSNKSSSQSQRFSVINVEHGLGSSVAIEESMEEIYFDESKENSIQSAK